MKISFLIIVINKYTIVKFNYFFYCRQGRERNENSSQDGGDPSEVWCRTLAAATQSAGKSFKFESQ